MIFVTVGTEKFAFDRLIRLIDEAVGDGRLPESVFFQIGSSQVSVRHGRYARFVEFASMQRLLKDSRCVVSHAGVGSTLLCLHHGKVPILFPRRVEFGEHFDNHQVEFASRIGRAGKALVACTGEELLDLVSHYSQRVRTLRSTPSAYGDLAKHLRGLVQSR